MPLFKDLMTEGMMLTSLRTENENPSTKETVQRENKSPLTKYKTKTKSHKTQKPNKHKTYETDKKTSTKPKNKNIQTYKQLDMISMRTKRRGSEGKFPGKLHDMMTYVEEENLDSVICWVLNGRGFKINHPDRLVDILPMFFDLTKYRSFRRQLNMWHFQRVMDGPNKGAFIHPYFVRNHRSLCNLMTRQINPSLDNKTNTAKKNKTESTLTTNSMMTIPSSSISSITTEDTDEEDNEKKSICEKEKIDKIKANLSKLTERIQRDLVSFDKELLKNQKQKQREQQQRMAMATMTMMTMMTDQSTVRPTVINYSPSSSSPPPPPPQPQPQPQPSAETTTTSTAPLFSNIFDENESTTLTDTCMTDVKDGDLVLFEGRSFYFVDDFC